MYVTFSYNENFIAIIAYRDMNILILINILLQIKLSYRVEQFCWNCSLQIHTLSLTSSSDIDIDIYSNKFLSIMLLN